MNPDDIIRYTSQAMVVCLLVCLPALISSAVVGLVVAFLQAVTSLQDASISHSIKLLVVSSVIAVTAPWAGSQLVSFAQSLFAGAFRL